MKADKKKSLRKSLVTIALLFTVVFSLGGFISPATAETSGPVGGASKPTVEFIDFNNGTTLTIVDYHNGTRDEITETILTKSEYQLGNGTADQSLTLTLPTTQKESTDYTTVTQDAVLGQEVLMGFTYELVVYRKFLDVEFDIWLLKAYARAGIDVDIGFGLRLPVRITLEYPEQMTGLELYELYATLTPLDWPDYDEFLCKFKAVVWVEAGVWAPLVGWQRVPRQEFGPDYDWSRSFPTPLGPRMEFKLPKLEEREKTLVDFWLMKVKGVIDPQLGSDRITATASATGDATGEQTIRWSDRDQRIPFTIRAGDYDPTTDYAEIQLSDFRYYFSIFKLYLKLKFDFDNWIDWLTGDPEWEIYTLDMSWLTEGSYLRVHPGTLGVVAVNNIFVKKPTLPPFPEGGLAVAVKPKITRIYGFPLIYVKTTVNILVVNNENFDDLITVKLEGIPDLLPLPARTRWTEQRIFLPAGGRDTIPLTIWIPTVPLLLLRQIVFRVEATSALWDKGYAMTSGAIKVG